MRSLHLLGSLAAVPVLALPALAQSTTRVSVTSAGAQVSNGHSEGPSLSHDGRYVAFFSQAAGLVPFDTNTDEDVFVHDRYTGALERVSLTSAGAEAIGNSAFPSISADGRYVAFESWANFDPLYINSAMDVYVYDRQLDTIELATLNWLGQVNPFGNSLSAQISADGSCVVFESDSSQLVSDDNGAFTDVFLRDLLSNVTTRISVTSSGGPSASHSYNPTVSGNGVLVAFETVAANLVSGDTNSAADILLRNRFLGTTERVSISSTGEQANALSSNAHISADGRFVAFESLATNLVPNDLNGRRDIFVRDLLLGTTELVSLTSSGSQTNLHSHFPELSADGRYVTFRSAASNLHAGDTNTADDIYVRDRLLGTTTHLSKSSAGALGNSSSDLPAISGNGRLFAFNSNATNLVANDTNDRNDVFVHDPAGFAPGVAIRTGAGNVPSSLTANSQPAIGNAGFGLVYHNPTSSCGVTPGSFVMTALDFNGPTSLPLFNGCSSGSGTLLVNLFGPIPYFTKTGIWNGTPGTALLPIPASTSLLGLDAHGQSFFVVLPSIKIHPSDAVDLVIGQ
jgi:Tol biopolymer transport system component